MDEGGSEVLFHLYILHGLTICEEVKQAPDPIVRKRSVCDRHDIRRLPMCNSNVIVRFREFLSAGIKNSQEAHRQVRDAEKFRETSNDRKHQNL